MSHYVTGATIKALREKKQYTQKQLADLLHVSDKAVSKWETQRGLPDLALLEPLAHELGVSIAELLSGECIVNRNRAGNLQRTQWYVCPVCGNIIQAVGAASISCCGIALPALEAEEPDADHAISVERSDGEYYITLAHAMEKTHFISFIAYIGSDRLQFRKLYPEQNAEARFALAGHGLLYAYCNRHGLYKIKL